MYVVLTVAVNTVTSTVRIAITILLLRVLLLLFTIVTIQINNFLLFPNSGHARGL